MDKLRALCQTEFIFKIYSDVLHVRQESQIRAWKSTNLMTFDQIELDRPVCVADDNLLTWVNFADAKYRDATTQFLTRDQQFMFDFVPISDHRVVTNIL